MDDPKLVRGCTPHHWKAADGDTLVHTGKARIHTITINSPATTAGTVTVRDGTDATGDIKGIITVDTFANSFVPATLLWDADFATGIFLDHTTMVAGDITVSYVGM